MKKVFQIIIIVFVVFINLTHAQAPSTRIISSGNLNSNDEIWDLLGHGVANFEVDLMYIYGKLFVTPSMPDSANHKVPVFAEAYLFPLYSNLKKNGNSIISGDNRESFIILNFHNEFKKSNKELKSMVGPLKGLITHYNQGVNDGKVRLLVKDKNLEDDLSKDGFMCLGLVGDKNDIESTHDYFQMPLIELDFTELTTWNGVGNIPFPDFMKIKELVNKVHQKGRKLSVINCPNHKTVWDMLATSKVDFINTNDPVNVCNYLNERK
ncbi:MAG: hypothetical protein RBS73_16585 [Prolixibacteraceae bacterium]|jgi:glycerophosphoryl diester phosphodiesterase|nr:hypothetical protein [Prolixibacteraceae bacterium]